MLKGWERCRVVKNTRLVEYRRNCTDIIFFPVWVLLKIWEPFRALYVPCRFCRTGVLRTRVGRVKERFRVFANHMGIVPILCFRRFMKVFFGLAERGHN